ncbi:MAG: hypothetical protein IIW86_01170 [Clostridia bacterium]|nr:hypothetical protein [Clostridia bacterium]
MAMDNVVKKIKHVVCDLWQPTDVTFRYYTPFQANKALDRISGKVIIVETPDFGTLEYKGGLQMVDKPTLRIWFLQPRVKLDNDAIENEDAIQEMKVLAAQFVKQINLSGLFEPLKGELPYVPEQGIFDRGETGIGLDVSLKEIIGIKIC